MYKRILLTHIQELAKKYPIVTVIGPRQAGKTTLVKEAFPDVPYVNMEDADNRAIALADPKGFLASYPSGAIFDEIQRTPNLLSSIQVEVDRSGKNGMFILTGSHQAELHSAISQSLAGRTSILRLYPLSFEEMQLSRISSDVNEVIFKGGYPRIYKEDLPLSNAYSSYFQTYIERDVRQILQLKDIMLFEKFVKLLAGRIGQLVNYASLSVDVGVSSATIKEWISVLEATYIIVRLQPYFENFGKRMIKAPKIYFVDTGLAAYLLGIETKEQLVKDTLYGNLFENFIILEMMKSRYNRGVDPQFYFFRDTNGREVDLLIKKGSFLVPVEIKSGMTFNPSFLNGQKYFHAQAKESALGGAVIYGGDKSQKVGEFTLLNPITSLQILS